MKKHKRRQLEIKKQKREELKNKEQELRMQELQQVRRQQMQNKNNYTPENLQRKRGCLSLTVTPELLVLILLSIAIAIGVKECKRSDIRLEREIKLQKLYDSILQQHMMDTATLDLSRK